MNWPSDQAEKRHALLNAVESVRETVQKNVPYGERNGHLHKDTTDAIHESGLLSLKLPTELGGAEADPVLQTEVLGALAAIDTSAAWCTMVGATNVGSAGAFLPDKGIDIVFPENTHPSIVGVGMTFGKAIPTEGGFLIDGRWPYGSGIKSSTWVAAGAKVVPVSEDSLAKSDIRALFKTSEVTIIDNWDVAGLKGSGSNDYEVSESFVPQELTWSGDHIPERGGSLFNIKRPAFVVFGHAGIAIGTAGRAIREAKEFAVANSRGLPGESHIVSQAYFQRELGDMDLSLRSMKALTKDVFGKSWEVAKSGGILSEKEQSRIRAVGSRVTRESLQIVTAAFQIAGGTALHVDNPLQQCFRDMYAAAQHFMVSPVHIESYGAAAISERKSRI
ncbi:uncharacterized protein METZ01_LOCUS220311 [marine metagenome]|uniref:Acyl-CoA dehydrogenase C-terminal domain-containing protein n=1 Tax=marine metagenome TaxID=408172 RepID=A0A382FYY3_9ZZZZ